MISRIEQHKELHPPPAFARPKIVEQNGLRRIDEYHWMHNLEDPRMREYLRANNKHAETVMAPLRPLHKKLFAELKALTPADEGSAGYVSGNYWYQTRFPRNSEYPVFVRHRVDPPGPEEILLDENELARGHELFVCEDATVSPRHDRMVYSVDTTGDCEYTLYFKDLATGKLYPETIAGADSHCVWANDNHTLFYTMLERETYRPYQVRRHVLGTDPASDPVVYEEADATCRCLLLPTRSQRFILLNVYSNNAEEMHILDANRPTDNFEVFFPRQPGHQYEIEDDGERFLIRTNWQAPDFRICEAPSYPSSPAEWREIVPAQDGRLIDDLLAFHDFIVIIGFRSGLQKLFILDRHKNELHETQFPEPVCHIWLEENPDINASTVRIGYTSLKNPVTFYDYNMARRELSIVQSEEIPCYNPDDYTTECRWVKAADGVRIPVSLVYRNDTLRHGPAPLLIFGYGQYGTNIPVYFDQTRLALLDRGFIYAMAHVRGGTELGSHWHEDGKRLRKKNTFTDFITIVECLTQEGLADKNQIYAESLSSGGLLLGATINMRPDLFRGIYACKPFVDPLTAVADPSLPLTCFEYDELGHPDNRAEMEYMQSYAPYDNIRRQPYPHMLTTAAVNDSQVPGWEPVKWVARLRTHNTAKTQILLKTDMAAGHAGVSGRMEHLNELAFMYAFLLDLAGKQYDI